MHETIPDHWVILQITTSQETFYKVLAGWSGGFTTGDSWKLNSGVASVEEDENFYFFHGSSGSVYKCSKVSEELRGMPSMIYGQLKDLHGDKIELISAIDMKPEYIKP